METWAQSGTTDGACFAEYSTSLLIFLLKAARPEKYRDNWTGEIPHPQAAPRIDLSRLNDAERKELKALARKVDSKRRTG